MTREQKIHDKHTWLIARSNVHIADIIGATYRQALTYANQLRRHGCDHVLPKPVLER